MVDPSPPASATYQWNTGGCFTNDHHITPTCFPTGQTTQTITDNSLLAEDAGIIACTVNIGGVGYCSNLLTIRVSGMICVTISMCYSNLYVHYSNLGLRKSVKS